MLLGPLVPRTMDPNWFCNQMPPFPGLDTKGLPAGWGLLGAARPGGPTPHFNLVIKPAHSQPDLPLKPSKFT